MEQAMQGGNRMIKKISILIIILLVLLLGLVVTQLLLMKDYRSLYLFSYANLELIGLFLMVIGILSACLGLFPLFDKGTKKKWPIVVAFLNGVVLMVTGYTQYFVSENTYTIIPIEEGIDLVVYEQSTFLSEHANFYAHDSFIISSLTSILTTSGHRLFESDEYEMEQTSEGFLIRVIDAREVDYEIEVYFIIDQQQIAYDSFSRVPFVS